MHIFLYTYSMAELLPNNREKNRRWFQNILTLRRKNYEAREKKRNETAKEGERERREKWEQVGRTATYQESEETKAIQREKETRHLFTNGRYLKTQTRFVW